MRVFAKFWGDIILFLVFVQAFVLLCLEEQILQSTRLLGALEDESERLQTMLVQQQSQLDIASSSQQVLDCANKNGLHQAVLVP